MCGVPKLLWVFLEPFCTVFFDRVENSGFEPLKDQAVGPFDLAIAPGVCYGGIVDVDAVSWQ